MLFFILPQLCDNFLIHRRKIAVRRKITGSGWIFELSERKVKVRKVQGRIKKFLEFSLMETTAFCLDRRGEVISSLCAISGVSCCRHRHVLCRMSPWLTCIKTILPFTFLAAKRLCSKDPNSNHHPAIIFSTTHSM